MKLVIYGNNDFAEMMTYYFSNDSMYQIVGYCADSAFIQCDKFLGKRVVAFEEVATVFSPLECKMFVAIGYKNMRLRKLIFEKTKNKGFCHVNYISSKAHYDGSNLIGTNNAILHNTVLEPFAKIGDNNIINTSCILCHHSIITNHCFIAAKSSIGGYTFIGENSFLGFGSTVLQKLTIATETLVAAQSVMTKNSIPHTRYMGIPAKANGEHSLYGITITD